MQLRDLRYIVAVAEELNFSRAAMRLNMSQPPLSHQIQQFENELGVRIFQRTKREVRLTEAGRRIVAEAYRVLSQVDRLTKAATQARNGDVGHLSVGALGGVQEILVETLSIFARQHPGVHVELQYTSTAAQIQALREGRMQVCFLSLPVHHETLAVEVVKEEPLRIALPKTHPLARCERVALSALADEPFIFVLRRVTPGFHDLVTGICRDAGFNLKVVHEVDSPPASLTLVGANLGLAFCVASMESNASNIVFRPLQHPEPQVQYGMVYKRDAQSSPVVNSFLEVVRQVVRRTARPPAKSKEIQWCRK
jgi:DNA-binding transcriptional LysR family regulator